MMVRSTFVVRWIVFDKLAGRMISSVGGDSIVRSSSPSSLTYINNGESHMQNHYQKTYSPC